MVILAIIFPEAHWADFVTTASVKGLVTTAWATVRLSLFGGFRDVFEHARILHSTWSALRPECATRCGLLAYVSVPVGQVLINALTGQVGTGTKI